MAAGTPHNSYRFLRISRAHGATSEETRISDSVLRTCHSMLCSLSNAPNVLTTKTIAGCRRCQLKNKSTRTVPGDSVPGDSSFRSDSWNSNKNYRTDHCKSRKGKCDDWENSRNRRRSFFLLIHYNIPPNRKLYSSTYYNDSFIYDCVYYSWFCIHVIHRKNGKDNVNWRGVNG